MQFERAYATECSCGEALDWEWSPELIEFIATCASCMRNHKLIPLTGEIERDRIESEDETEQEADFEE